MVTCRIAYVLLLLPPSVSYPRHMPKEKALHFQSACAYISTRGYIEFNQTVAPNIETDDDITPLLSAIAAVSLPCAEPLFQLNGAKSSWVGSHLSHKMAW
ncbi:hypothetical protein L6452_05982 [Arctium lappa]|uniref:Uncharacterized protein n=1 Tax=Arctium lappa TaxID=4217 RepID=A0ACB9EI84_ARCLA|nr:hypothetical protein L6452_05982 [Arctium lappa]